MTEILVGKYLFERLKQLGVKTVFGVPGDYELMLLDLIPEAGLTWRGNPNELNAGYAADGYARISGVGAVVTTFGPGELSNMCPIAGSYTEFVPVVHIVGYPTEAAQHGTNILHHTLGEVGDGKFDVYHQMSKGITCASTVLHDERTAATEIDRVLNAMLFYSQPVYIGIPTDVAFKPTPSFNLKVPLSTSLPPNHTGFQSHVIEKIRGLLDAASNPIIIVDGGASRNGVIPEAKALAEATGYPYFVTAMSKGSIGEELPNFGGFYGGAATLPGIKKVVESSDCVLWVGNYPSDFNTGEFTDKVSETVTIDFQRFYIKIGGLRYDVKMKYVLQGLLENFKQTPLTQKSQPVTWEVYQKPTREDLLTQDYLWAALGTYFRNSDLIIPETGTSSYGIPGSSLQKTQNVTMFNQTVFGSIGFATGAAVGAFVANKEREGKGRNILITGEGSLQLTVQAFADLLRWEVCPTVFVLNNNGYTVERLIHGRDAAYNEVPKWDYGALFQAFGPDYKTKHYLIRTTDELDALLRDEEFNNAGFPQIVELILDKYDAPVVLRLATVAVAEFNKK